MFVLLEQCVIFAIWPNHTSSFLSRSSLSGYSCLFLNTLFHSQGLHQNIWSLLQHPLTIGRLVPFYKDRYNFYREVFSAFVYNAVTRDMIDKQWLQLWQEPSVWHVTQTEARIYQWLDLVWLGSFTKPPLHSIWWMQLNLKTWQKDLRFQFHNSKCYSSFYSIRCLFNVKPICMSSRPYFSIFIFNIHITKKIMYMFSCNLDQALFWLIS